MNRNEDKNEDNSFNPFWPFFGKNKIEVSYKKGILIAIAVIIGIPFIFLILLVILWPIPK